MYNEFFEKCGLEKANKDTMMECIEMDELENVLEIWMDMEDGVDYVIYENGEIEELNFRGGKKVSIEEIGRLYGIV